jgi:hypothetical protein
MEDSTLGGISTPPLRSLRYLSPTYQQSLGNHE